MTFGEVLVQMRAIGEAINAGHTDRAAENANKLPWFWRRYLVLLLVLMRSYLTVRYVHCPKAKAVTVRLLGRGRRVGP